MNVRHTKFLITCAALVLLPVAYLGIVDNVGRQYTEQGLKRALITFGVARGLNGVISVAQGTEVAFEPVGIGLTFTPGELLDPVNDLVERFSWVVLASSTSLGIQRVLLNVTTSKGFTLCVSCMVFVSVIVLWWGQRLAPGVRRTCYKFTLVLMIARYSIPAIAICSEWLYDYFLEPQYTQSQQELEKTASQIGQLNRETRLALQDHTGHGIIENLKRAYESASSAVNIERRLEALKQAAANISEHALNLIVVFVLQTILFPLMFLWLVLQLIKQAIKARWSWLRR